MPADAVDFTSLGNFKKSIMRVDITAHLAATLATCYFSKCLNSPTKRCRISRVSSLRAENQLDPFRVTGRMPTCLL